MHTELYSANTYYWVYIYYYLTISVLLLFGVF